jgi:phosphonopyruvate decarboxylase
MHMGAMAVIGANAPHNLIHVVINNGAHESVGGMPTVAKSMHLTALAEACGYSLALSADNVEELDRVLEIARDSNKLCFVEICTGIGARENLGRPTNSTMENKKLFMDFLKSIP